MVDFNAIGGNHMMLHMADGSVGTARYTVCPTCRKRGMLPGTDEGPRDVDAWAERVGFTWPDAPPRDPPRRAVASGCIVALDAAAG